MAKYPKKSNDLQVFYNGLLVTQDKNHPRATALVVQDDRILAVGNDELCSQADSAHQLINLEGRLVLPGLVDSHFHYYDWALARKQIALSDINCLADLKARIAAAADLTPPNKWILGQGWNETGWPTPEIPTRADLDAITPNHPAILWRNDMHLALVNSRALQTAGITAQTPDPERGIIDRDPSGIPTGVLREMAIHLVQAVIPKPADNEISAAFSAGFTVLHRMGLVGLHDFRMMGGECWSPAYRAFQQLNRSENLSLRIWMQLPGERLDQVIDQGFQTGSGDPFLRIGHIKLFLDGSQGARTAWMLEPYEDTASVGMQLLPLDELSVMVKRAHSTGLAVAVHAIGDRANRELINIFENVLLPNKAASAPSAPHRIEHVQNILKNDIKRLAKLGVIASVQPIHAPVTYLMIEKAVGSRAGDAFPLKDLMNAGVPLAMGSDSPVADPNPFSGIQAAITRQRYDGTPKDGWYPEQCLSINEAIWGYTMGPALASGQERETGSLSPGKLADFIVLDRNIFEIPAMEITDTQVLMTVVNGNIHYRV